MKHPRGKPELQSFIVSERHVNNNWPATDLDAIADARRLHELGRVTMCQGREGDIIIQYAIPTKRVVKRAPYFFYKEYTC